MKQEKWYKKLSKLVNGLKPKQGLEKDIFENILDPFEHKKCWM